MSTLSGLRELLRSSPKLLLGGYVGRAGLLRDNDSESSFVLALEAADNERLLPIRDAKSGTLDEALKLVSPMLLKRCALLLLLAGLRIPVVFNAGF